MQGHPSPFLKTSFTNRKCVTIQQFVWEMCWEKQLKAKRVIIDARWLIFTTRLSLVWFYFANVLLFCIELLDAESIECLKCNGLCIKYRSLSLLLAAAQSRTLKGAQRLRPPLSNSISLPSKFSTKPKPKKYFSFNFFGRPTFSHKFLSVWPVNFHFGQHKRYIIESWISFQMTWWLVVKNRQNGPPSIWSKSQKRRR